MSDLYLCDPRKNSSCRGTVCFWDSGVAAWCCLTPDPACAVTGPEGGPLAVDTDAGVAIHDRVSKEGGWIWPPKADRPPDRSAGEYAADAATP